MTTLPRRSARLSHRAEPQQFSNLPISSFSPTSSTSTTSHPSPNNDFVAIPAQPQQSLHHLQLQLPVPTLNFAAPLPSPSVTDSEPFLNSSQWAFQRHSDIMGGEQQNQNHGTQNTSHQLQPHQPHSQAHHHNSFSSQTAQRPTFGAHQNQDTSLPPPDLLAEAAKRAQMACLMRDLGDVAL